MAFPCLPLIRRVVAVGGIIGMLVHREQVATTTSVALRGIAAGVTGLIFHGLALPTAKQWELIETKRFAVAEIGKRNCTVMDASARVTNVTAVHVMTRGGIFIIAVILKPLIGEFHKVAPTAKPVPRVRVVIIRSPVIPQFVVRRVMALMAAGTLPRRAWLPARSGKISGRSKSLTAVLL